MYLDWAKISPPIFLLHYWSQKLGWMWRAGQHLLKFFSAENGKKKPKIAQSYLRLFHLLPLIWYLFGSPFLFNLRGSAKLTSSEVSSWCAACLTRREKRGGFFLFYFSHAEQTEVERFRLTGATFIYLLKTQCVFIPANQIRSTVGRSTF